MSDIVDALRGNWPEMVADDAADEIERLRRQVDQATRALTYYAESGSTVAIEALREMEK